MSGDHQEQAFMMRALLLSHQALPACRPNPLCRVCASGKMDR